MVSSRGPHIKTACLIPIGLHNAHCHKALFAFAIVLEKNIQNFMLPVTMFKITSLVGWSGQPHVWRDAQTFVD